MRGYILSAMLLCTSIMMAQSHVIGVGIRGGGAHFLQKMQADEVKRQTGGNANLDLNYTCYFPTWTALECGVRTGLSLGYSTSGLKGSLHETFTNTDYLGNTIEYTVDFESVKERTQELQLEIPIMAALRWKGLVANVGPKLMIPVWRRATQEHSMPTVDAYYPDFDVHVTDATITGTVANPDEMNGQGQWCTPVFNFMLGFELGYEWRVKKQHLLGLMATLNISAAGVYNNKADGKVVSVSDITDPDNPVPSISFKSLSEATVNNMHPLDFGLKFYYAFEIIPPWRSHLHHHWPRG